jgi:hypothetical protein
MKETDNGSMLRRWFNPLPIKWFDTTKFFEQFGEYFGEGIDTNNQMYNVRTEANIKSLVAMYQISVLLMQDQNRKTVFGILLKSKAKESKNNLLIYQAKIKKMTMGGIDILKKDGLKKLAKEIERRQDKFQENNPQQAEQVEIDFMEYALGIFSVCEMQFNGGLKLYQLAKLKDRADKIITKLNSKK